MRKWQLEYGAEIGRAVTNFRGPIVFVVVSRYHGGAFVVFSKRLHDDMETAAVAGSFASVIGGAPAAGVVFSREVTARTEKDPRVASARARLGSATGKALADVHHELAEATRAVRAEKLKEVADEFDGIHDIKRAMRVGLSTTSSRPPNCGHSSSVRSSAGWVDCRGRQVTGRSSQRCERGHRCRAGDSASSGAGGGPLPGQQAVNRNAPLRRHQPVKTAPSVARTWSGDQACSGGLRSATLTSTERVSRRRPVPSTLSALSLADHRSCGQLVAARAGSGKLAFLSPSCNRGRMRRCAARQSRHRSRPQRCVPPPGKRHSPHGR